MPSASPPTKMLISRRAVEQRVVRALHHQELALRRSRSAMQPMYDVLAVTLACILRTRSFAKRGFAWAPSVGQAQGLGGPPAHRVRNATLLGKGNLISPALPVPTFAPVRTTARTVVCPQCPRFANTQSN
jgi:hypothetical protein